MSDNDAFEYKDMGLKDLIRALSETMPVAKVGILGGKSFRSLKGDKVRNSKQSLPVGNAPVSAGGEDLTNADIGKKHEFGDDGLPMRSFLRLPITENMQKYLDESKFFGQDEVKLVLKEKSIIIWMKKIAIVAESIVADAFATGGFGKWKPSNMKNKKVQQTLVETQQLRNSITSEVK